MSLDPLIQFSNYAQAFEVALVTDDWQPVGQYFTEDATVEVDSKLFGSHTQGRENILAYFRRSVERFDRRFDSREPLELSAPTLKDGGVYFPWIVTYRRKNLPPLELKGEEWDWYQDGLIARHLERLSNEQEVAAWMAEYGKQLRPHSGSAAAV